MNKLCLFVFSPILIFLTLFRLNSQDLDLKKLYEEHVVQINGISSTFGRPRFILDNRVLSYQEFTPMLGKFPESWVEFKAAKNNYNTSTILFIGGLACYTLLFTQTGLDSGWALGIGLVGLGSIFGAIPIRYSGDKHLQNSVWYYNRDILLEHY